MKLKILASLIITTCSFCFTYQAQAEEQKNDHVLILSLLDNVIIPDVDRAQNAIASLRNSITSLGNESKRSEAIDKDFTNLVKSWKAVQALYIAGEINNDMLDTPRLMDTYHEGNENLNKQIARAILSGDEPQIALFKNTFKSINALGIMLYSDNELSKTERNYAEFTLKTLSEHLESIKNAYSSADDFLQNDSDKVMSFVLNALIDSSFKLKEWRIGEAAGLAKKYKDKADSRRQEYPLSKNSIAAAISIINIHDAVMGKQDYENLGSIAGNQGASNEVLAIQKLIDSAKQQLSILETEKIANFEDPRMKKLYETLSKLNDAYYQSLVKALPVQAKILDADGD